MPNAVANISERFEHDLKTVEGGHVTLRRMTYGESVQRKAMVKLSMKGTTKADTESEIAMANIEINNFEFARCILEHNLTDEQGNLLNFKHAPDIARLDPRTGEEIETLISDLHRWDDEDEAKN